MFFVPTSGTFLAFLFRGSEVSLQVFVACERFPRTVGGDDDPFSDTPIFFQFALGQIAQAWYDDLHELRLIFRQLAGEALIGGLGFFESGKSSDEDVEGGLKRDDDGGLATDHPEQRGGSEKTGLPKSSGVCFDVVEKAFGKKLLEDCCEIAGILR